MHFASPHFLWLLLALPLIAFWWLRQRRAALTYPALSALAPLPAGRTRLVEGILLGLRLAVLALLILALARPRWPDEHTSIPARSTAIMIVLDVSGSMAEKDFAQNGQKLSRLAAAQLALRQFITGDGADAGRSEHQVGLLTFAARAEQICPPTLSHATVLRMLEDAQPVGQPPDAVTNIGDALAEAIALVQRARPSEKSIVLISDGEHNVPANVVVGALRPRQAARLAVGVRVHTIFVGPEAEENKAARQALIDVAAMTAGIALRAGDTEGLQDVGRQIDQAERTRVESFVYYRYREIYPWLGLACLVFTLVGLSLEATRWLRVP